MVDASDVALIVDLRTLVARRGPALDVDYVRAQMIAMMGEDDERVAEWDRICTEEMTR